MGDVVHLSFRATTVVDDPDTIRFIACKHCRNKTYILFDKPGDFPMLRCAACGTDMGPIGFAPPSPDAGA